MALSTVNVPMPRKLGGGTKVTAAVAGFAVRCAARRARVGAAAALAAVDVRKLSLDARLTLSYVGGLALVAAGVAMIFVPAGLICAGVCASVSAVAYARNAAAAGDAQA